MREPETLAAAFESAVPKDAPADAGPNLEAALATVIRDAKAAWPQLAGLDELHFARYLGARVKPGPATRQEALGKMKAADLYLAASCTLHEHKAVAAVQGLCTGPLRGALLKLGIAAALVDDVSQTVLERILLPKGDALPKIGEYDGSGELKKWLTVAVTREAIYLANKHKREVSLSDELLDAPVSEDDPENAFLKAHYRAEYRQAFAAAMGQLTNQQRTFLREHYIQGLTVDQIGALHDLHRASAARRVAQAREALMANTRRELLTRLSLPREELEQVLELIKSRLDLSLTRLLK